LQEVTKLKIGKNALEVKQINCVPRMIPFSEEWLFHETSIKNFYFLMFIIAPSSKSVCSLLSPDKLVALSKINFQQKFNVLLCVVGRYQTDYANTNLGESALQLDL